MSTPRKHPVGNLLALAEEFSRIMWNYYDIHMTADPRGPEWLEEGWKLMDMCVAADARVRRIKQQMDRALGPQDGTPGDHRITDDPGPLHDGP